MSLSPASTIITKRARGLFGINERTNNSLTTCIDATMLRAWDAETKETGWTAQERLGGSEQDLQNFSDQSDNVDVLLETDCDSFINYSL